MLGGVKSGKLKVTPNSKHILLVAATTGYQTRAFAAAGERLGYRIQLATDRCHVLDDPWGDSAIALRFERPELAASMIEKAARKTGRFDGIVAVGDRPAHLAALAAERLGLRFSAPDAVLACRNKFLARERFRSGGLLTPEYLRLAIEDGAAGADDFRYPCVLKPLGLSASRGVIRADNPAEFAAAFERIRNILAAPDIVRMHEDQDRFIHVEDYIDGQEFALEGLMTRGRFECIALFDKPDPLTGPFFEETLYITPSRAPEPVQKSIIETTRKAVAVLGLSDGPVHAEMRVNDRGVWMLEMAARPIGGLCAQALRFTSGLSLEDVLLQHAAGDPVGSFELNAAGRGVMMIPIPQAGVFAQVLGLEDARSTPGIEDIVITAKQGQKLVPLPEGASYLGFIFGAADSSDAVEKAIRGAHSKLRFEMLEALPVL